MIYPTKALMTKKISLIKRRIRFPQWRILLLSVLLLAATILFVHLRQLPAIAAQEAATNASALPSVTTLPTPPPVPLKPTTNLAATPSIWPVRGTISSKFGWRTSPFGGGKELHPGIDIAYTMGAPVVATADGEVTMSGPDGGYGNLVEIDHKNGISTLYGHNSQLIVHAGQQVKKGQVIAYAGSTGKSTGPHVHYEVRVNDKPIDPMKYLVVN